MSKKQIRTCCVCHSNYTFCPVCNPEDREKPTWYFVYCSENCKDIYKVTSDYENGQITANNAKLQLDKLELGNLKTFGESYQNTISKINKELSSLKEENKTVYESEKDFEINKKCKDQKQKKVSNISNVE